MTGIIEVVLQACAELLSAPPWKLPWPWYVAFVLLLVAVAVLFVARG